MANTKLRRVPLVYNTINRREGVKQVSILTLSTAPMNKLMIEYAGNKEQRSNDYLPVNTVKAILLISNSSSTSPSAFLLSANKLDTMHGVNDSEVYSA